MKEQSRGNRPWRMRFKRTAKQIGPLRFAGTILLLLLAVAFARYGWAIPLANDAERSLYDMRMVRAAPRVPQDERIVMVNFNDETLEKLGKRSPLDRKMLADALAAIDAMKPAAIGIDILIDQAQAEDPILIETFRKMKTPTYLAFASNETNPEYMQYWQEQFLTNFLKEVAGGPVRPASIMLQPDQADGVIRSWPEQPRSLPPLLGNAMTSINPAFRNYTRSIDFLLPANPDEPVFSKLPIENFTEDWASALRPMIEGRYVLIGGDIQDQDDYETPMSRSTGQLTKGIEVHAQLLAQLLDGRMPGEIPAWALWVSALGVVVAGGLTSLLEVRSWKLALVLAGQTAFLVALPFYLQGINVDTQSLPAFGWGLGWVLAFGAVGTAARALGSEQRRFAQSALGKYLPKDIANEIIRDPDRLGLSGEKREIYAMFTDLEGFTKLSHAITPEQLSSLLNHYLDVLSEIVLRHGGTIDKFVGDAVVAFWGAPIARPDDADRAVLAATAMYQAGEEFKKVSDPDLPAIGCTRVGLHWGEAVVGNFGGVGRIQYTALGDGMNTAARLESANKALKTTALVSGEVKSRCTLDVFRPMGRIVLSGRGTPVEVWEPKPDMDAELRQKLTKLWERYDAGDGASLTQLEELASANSDDAALASFVYRIRTCGPGGHFVLESK
jgi:adenylate cyclase